MQSFLRDRVVSAVLVAMVSSACYFGGILGVNSARAQTATIESVTIDKVTLSEPDRTKAKITIVLDGRASQDETFKINYPTSATATAQHDVDFTGPTTVTIRKRKRKATFTVRAIDDNKVEDDEIGEIRISGRNDPIRFTIVSDDVPPPPPTKILMSMRPYTLKEGGGARSRGRVLVVINQRAPEGGFPINIAYDNSSGLPNAAAKLGEDFTGPPSVTIPAGEISTEFYITTIDDTVHESGSFGLEFSRVVASATAGGRTISASVGFNIDDNDKKKKENKQEAADVDGQAEPKDETQVVDGDSADAGQTVENKGAVTAQKQEPSKVLVAEPEVLSTSGAQVAQSEEEPVRVDTLTASPRTITEGQSSDIKVTLNGPAPVGGFVVALTYFTDGTSSFREFTAAPSLTIEHRATEGTITLEVPENAASERTSTVINVLASPDGKEVPLSERDKPGVLRTDVTVRDEEEPVTVLRLTADPKTIFEVGELTKSTVTVQLSRVVFANEAASDVQLSYSGSAVLGENVQAPTSIKVPDGKSTVKFDVVALADTDDDDETVIVSAGGESETITIEDAPPLPIVDDVTASGFKTTGAFTTTESDEAVITVTVNLDKSAPAGGLNVPVILDGAATLGTDYVVVEGLTDNGELTFADDDKASFTLKILNDDVSESTEGVTVRVGGESLVMQIFDDDKQPTVDDVKVSRASIKEAGGVSTITIELSGEVLQSADGFGVPIIFGGAATLGTDYNFAGFAGNRVGLLSDRFRLTNGRPAVPAGTRLTNARLTIPAGATRGSLTIAATDDTEAEANEQLVLTIGDPAGPTITKTVTITDDDGGALPTVSVFPGQTPVSEGGVAQFIVSRFNTQDLNQPLPVRIALSGAESFLDAGTSLAGVVTIEANDPSATVSIRTDDDQTDEEDADLKLTILADAAYVVDTKFGSDTVTITDDDAPAAPVVAEVTASPETISEDGEESIITVRLSPELSATFGDGREITGEYEARRLLLSGHLTGRMVFGNLLLSPQLGVVYGREKQDGFTDSSNAAATAEILQLARLEFGTTVAYAFDLKPEEGALGVTLTATGRSDFIRPDDVDDRYSLAVRLGLEWVDTTGLSLKVEGGADGIGLDDYDGYDASATVKVPF